VIVIVIVTRLPTAGGQVVLVNASPGAARGEAEWSAVSPPAPDPPQAEHSAPAASGADRSDRSDRADQPDRTPLGLPRGTSASEAHVAANQDRPRPLTAFSPCRRPGGCHDSDMAGSALRAARPPGDETFPDSISGLVGRDLAPRKRGRKPNTPRRPKRGAPAAAKEKEKQVLCRPISTGVRNPEHGTRNREYGAHRW